ncbi:MAG: cation:proton antiporter [Firmicutes bacterium]|nr:cation:proton antiporter [Bacillota bacterium]
MLINLIDIIQIKDYGFDFLLALGLIVGIGFIAKFICEKIGISHIVGFIILGVLLGRSFFHVINPDIFARLEIVGMLALSMLGFVLGGELNFSKIKGIGNSIPLLAVFESTLTFIIVFGCTFYYSRQMPLALILGAMAATTAPVAMNVFKKYNSRGPLTRTIFSVIGLDDVVAVFLYALAFSFARALLDMGQVQFNLAVILGVPLAKMAGCVIIGIIIGGLAHFALKICKKNQDYFVLSLALILISAGVARSLGLSVIITSFVLGTALAGFSPDNKKIFDELYRFTPPFYIFLIVFAGVLFDVKVLPLITGLAVIYLIVRTVGKLIGARLGAGIAGADANVRKYLGLGLLSQAGIGLCFAIESYISFRNLSPEGAMTAGLIISIIVITVPIFELITPPLIKMAIFEAGEAEKI